MLKHADINNKNRSTEQETKKYLIKWRKTGIHRGINQENILQKPQKIKKHLIIWKR